MSRDDPTATTITKEFGRFINGLQNMMSSQDIVWFLNCYKMLAHRGLTRAGDSRGDPAMVKLITRLFNSKQIGRFSGYGL